MSTEMIARGIAGSLRLAGVSAAVAVGIAGFATVGAAPAAAATDVSAASGSSELPAKACDALRAHAPAKVVVRHGCIVIDGPGEVVGAPIFS